MVFLVDFKGMKKDSESPALATLIRQGMRNKGYKSVRSLAIDLDLSVEHIRGVVHGFNVPSDVVLAQICDVLHLPFHAAQKLAETQRKEVSFVRTALGDEKCLALVKMWHLLSDPEKDRLLSSAVAFVRSPEKGNATSN